MSTNRRNFLLILSALPLFVSCKRKKKRKPIDWSLKIEKLDENFHKLTKGSNSILVHHDVRNYWSNKGLCQHEPDVLTNMQNSESPICMPFPTGVVSPKIWWCANVYGKLVFNDFWYIISTPKHVKNFQLQTCFKSINKVLKKELAFEDEYIDFLKIAQYPIRCNFEFEKITNPNQSYTLDADKAFDQYEKAKDLVNTFAKIDSYNQKFIIESLCLHFREKEFLELVSFTTSLEYS